ncbi:MAG: type II secretion system protein [Desulfamplus sp.]|nr:type II secretion system protein [Desulfamplus sp.]
MKISGYTLLEVMVALIIIGISITAVTGALSTAKGLSARADHAVDSVRIMKNILNNPELMKTILENKNFEKVLEDEDGWVCRTETTPLVINSADLVWDIDGTDSNSNQTTYRKNNTENNSRQKNKMQKSRRVGSDEEIEIPGMVSVSLCVRKTNQLIEKEYCVSRWKRQDSQSDAEMIMINPAKKEGKTGKEENPVKKEKK